MKHTLILMLALAALAPVATAQEAPLPQDNQSTAQLPQWLIDFSNLPRNDREQYLRAFNNAKQSYQQGQWVACIGYLADCEMIFRGNPNVWNLRACCLMEQKFFDEAAAELERVRKALPNDPVTAMNLANMHMARGHYKESISTLNELRDMLPFETPKELLHVLDFRELLCHVMLGQEAEARKLVAGLSPISDTPLYYYSQAVFALAANNRIEASRNLRVANSIFSKGNITVPYQRALELSGITNRQPSGPLSR